MQRNTVFLEVVHCQETIGRRAKHPVQLRADNVRASRKKPQLRSAFTLKQRRLSRGSLWIFDHRGDNQRFHCCVAIACVNLQLDCFSVFVGRNAFSVSIFGRPGTESGIDDRVHGDYFPTNECFRHDIFGTTEMQGVNRLASNNSRDYTVSMAGRPKKTKDEAMSTYVRIRVTPAERAAIARRWRKAKARNESVWIRQRLLDDE